MSRRHPTPVNIRNFSVKCGRCGEYPALAAYEPGDEVNTYRFECDEPDDGGTAPCSQILLEIPTDLDEFANRDPKWGGGKVHAGADARAEEAGEPARSEAAPSDEGTADAAEAPAGGEASPSEPRSTGLLPVLPD
ncbi:MAG: hypothetical protein AAGF23_03545 [Acidobacteriota bacterium]